MADLHADLPQWMKVPSPPAELAGSEPSWTIHRLPDKPSSVSAVIKPGTAQYVSMSLGQLGLGCRHFPKGYNPDTHSHQYPSRLGFFHANTSPAEDGPHISFLDTDRFCLRCLDTLVPGRIFNYWTVATAPDESAVLGRQWLHRPASHRNYPPLYQSGMEDFRSQEASADVCRGPPVVIPMPDVPEAEEAWAWLSRERKPFYMDSLHLDRGWRLVAEKEAEKNAKIAQVYGVPFVPRTPVGASADPVLSGSLPGVSVASTAQTASDASLPAEATQYSPYHRPVALKPENSKAHDEFESEKEPELENHVTETFIHHMHPSTKAMKGKGKATTLKTVAGPVGLEHAAKLGKKNKKSASDFGKPTSTVRVKRIRKRKADDVPKAVTDSSLTRTDSTMFAELYSTLIQSNLHQAEEEFQGGGESELVPHFEFDHDADDEGEEDQYSNLGNRQQWYDSHDDSSVTNFPSDEEQISSENDQEPGDYEGASIIDDYM